MDNDIPSEVGANSPIVSIGLGGEDAVGAFKVSVVVGNSNTTLCAVDLGYKIVR